MAYIALIERYNYNMLALLLLLIEVPFLTLIVNSSNIVYMRTFLGKCYIENKPIEFVNLSIRISYCELTEKS